MSFKTKAIKIEQKQFIRLIKDSNKEDSNTTFGFILGAGASVTSGIPDANYFTKKWYPIIKEDLPEDKFEMWKEKTGISIEDNLSEFYTEIFEQRFKASKEVGNRELQDFMDEAAPGVGYSFFAQLLEQTKNKFVITTNFDTMTEDALFEFTKSKPLILVHELVSEYIDPTNMQRPTIIKIHRDFRYDPQNTKAGTNSIAEKWKKSLDLVLRNNAIIVIGYGGHDKSLMSYLEEAKDERKSIYWCYRKEDEIPIRAQDLLTKKDFIVEIKGFDELMLMIAKALEFKLLVDKENIVKSKIVVDAITRANNYVLQLNDLGEINLDENEKKAFKEFLSIDSMIYAKAASDDAMVRIVNYIKNHKMDFFNIKRRDVAKALSIAPETLSRRLKVLEEDGVLDRTRGKEKINENKLQMYIEKINNIIK